jgi:hypothetical protein
MIIVLIKELKMEITEQEKAFIRGLEKLTRETGIVIHGCGCCDSPSLYSIEKEKIPTEAGYCFGAYPGGEVQWMKPADYYWEKHKTKIVR